MQQNSFLAKDLMTKRVVWVTPDTPLTEAVAILTGRRFNGVPVVDESKKVVGILTEYDLVIKGSSIHLPTFIKLIQELEVYKKDKKLIRSDIKKILAMKVRDVMNPDPLMLDELATIQSVAAAFSEHHRVNPIPVVDHDKKLIGIISRSDFIKLFGAPSIKFKDELDEREIDKNINSFLYDFERRYVFVSKFRTRYWLLLSLFFLAVGFVVAVIFFLKTSSVG